MVLFCQKHKRATKLVAFFCHRPFAHNGFRTNTPIHAHLSIMYIACKELNHLFMYTFLQSVFTNIRASEFPLAYTSKILGVVNETQNCGIPN